MSVRVPVKRQLLAWAVERSGVDAGDLHRRFPDLHSWEAGEKNPTFPQLERFATATRAPVGYFFLDEAPVESLPIPDYRTLGNAHIAAPSADLLETIYLCQRRQDWFRNHCILNGHPRLPFIGSVDVRAPVTETAAAIRTALRFETTERHLFASGESALRRLIDTIEELGVLVMVNGVVGGNTHRRLDSSEFRGFALSDEFAPLVFVNGADTKAAQIFTLVHEVAHLWLGLGGVDDASVDDDRTAEVEVWCNRVAAEVLVPLDAVRAEYRGEADVAELERLARIYRVSTLVVLRRIFDAAFLEWDEYRARHLEELARVRAFLERRRGGSGGDFYLSHPLKVSRLFARAVIVDTQEGRTLHRDAYSLLATKKAETFARLARELGVA
ncbi:uncharacterized protein DUF955 [Rathayibacter sp. PhB151]|uniref:ImmA/IrrE family metallo-endopeptidase n=1 Tax=Rathayibacter sp. PhB151 TaxID=2485189 RepID=UPI0010628336|nr:ImmA/IrrE family metallo-endopeptidase [Rathayibacter sp. PhB151]TDX81470.1 uncharacterized protein DUF955 [Rathayibacter sp. PhB151]